MGHVVKVGNPILKARNSGSLSATTYINAWRIILSLNTTGMGKICKNGLWTHYLNLTNLRLKAFSRLFLRRRVLYTQCVSFLMYLFPKDCIVMEISCGGCVYISVCTGCLTKYVPTTIFYEIIKFFFSFNSQVQ